MAEDRNWDDVWKGNGNVVDWRLPSGATEDRNINQYRANIGHPRGWRSPSRVTEDRNFSSTTSWPPKPAWRLPFGAAEDRNDLDQVDMRAMTAGGRPLGRPRIVTTRQR